MGVSLYSQESCDLVMKLFAAYSTVHNLLAEKNVGGAGRRGQTTAAGKFPCLLPMASTVLVLKAIFKWVWFCKGVWSQMPLPL